jgi:hypothetical protein
VHKLSVFDDKDARVAKLPDVVGSSLTWEELTALVFQGSVFGKGRDDGCWVLASWDEEDACWCECVDDTQFGDFKKTLQAQRVVRCQRGPVKLRR